MSSTVAREMMARAVAAAAGGRTSPNPHVGAVVARGDEVLGVGFHAGPGQAHAEVAALLAAGEAARGATLYCTLEPCNHHGRTPPCTEAILAAGVKRVVIGCRDPKSYPAGPGLERLEEAGLRVELGVLEAECLELIEDFTCLTREQRPLMVGKAAVTLDGRLATQSGDSKWITGELARVEAHRMRDRADAVLVGVETVIADDPQLTVRHVAGRDPIRIVLDTNLRTPPTAELVKTATTTPTWLVHGPGASADLRAELAQRGALLIESPLDAHGRVDLRALARELGRRELMRVLVEGGSRVLGSLLDAGLCDQLAVFVAPMVLGDPLARPLAHRAHPVQIMSEATRLSGVRVRTFGDDVLIEGRVERR